MILENLSIYRGSEYCFSPNGPLLGRVKFHSDHGKVEILLTEDAAKKILAIVADGLVEASKKVACDLTAEVLTQAAITDQSERPALS